MTSFDFIITEADFPQRDLFFLRECSEPSTRNGDSKKKQEEKKNRNSNVSFET